METSQAPPEPELSENHWCRFKQSFIPYLQATRDSKKETKQNTAYFLAVAGSLALDSWPFMTSYN